MSADKFEGRLNMSIFTNIEKSITVEQFTSRYPSEKFLTFEKANVDEFIRSIYETTGGEIKKGGFNDTKEVEAIFAKAKTDLAKLKPIKVSEDGEIRTVFVLQKGTEDTLQKGEVNDLEKGKIVEAFEYSDKICFKKTGEEIKAKLLFVKEDIESKCEEKVEEIMEAMKSLPNLPTKNPNSYGYGEMVKCPYKVFDWAQTYCDVHGSAMEGENGEEAFARPSTPAEAKMNSVYNSLVYSWLDNAAEVKAIEMYENNLVDKSTYELSARQMIALKF